MRELGDGGTAAAAEGAKAQVPTKCFKTAPRDDCEVDSLSTMADAQARERETVSV
jgi:hypothetical protein